jgi:hypothetical protein
MINKDVVELEHESAQAEVDLARHQAWEHLCAGDRRALTEMLIDKIVIYPIRT